jgi:hypothetical protein
MTGFFFFLGLIGSLVLIFGLAMMVVFLLWVAAIKVISKILG